MKTTLREKFRLRFGRDPDVVARAPGRIEFIGNHTDYNGGLVLGAAIDRGVWVALARRTDGRRCLASDGRAADVNLPVDRVEKLSGAQGWANYPLGVLAVLPQFGLALPAGFDYLAAADLPEGAGLSSSAAIELASALAFLAVTGQQVSREMLVQIGRRAENEFVGMPCGILDQAVSGFGRRDHLVFIDCRGPRFDLVPLPGAAHFRLFNTHTKHALVDGLYAARHQECMAAASGLGVAFLAEASPAALASAEARLPSLAARRARHVIGENGRVAAAVDAVRLGDLAAVGRLLTASHRSSQTLFDNSTPELDFLVEALVAAPGVYGARLTGGGFGGAVMALTSEEFGGEQADQVAGTYAKKFGVRPELLHLRTGDGAECVP